MKDIKPIIRKLKDYIEKTEYWKYEDGLVLGSDEAQQLIEALEKGEDMKFWIDYVRKRNPYPSDVFTEPSEEEWKSAAKILTEHGISPDRIFAKWGRMVWNNCINNLESFLLPDKEIDKRTL